jgi:hypothetical protein
MECATIPHGISRNLGIPFSQPFSPVPSQFVRSLYAVDLEDANAVVSGRGSIFASCLLLHESLFILLDFVSSVSRILQPEEFESC